MKDCARISFQNEYNKKECIEQKIEKSELSCLFLSNCEEMSEQLDNTNGHYPFKSKNMAYFI